MFIAASDARASINETKRAIQDECNKIFFRVTKELIAEAIKNLEFETEPFDITDVRNATDPEWIEWVCDGLYEAGYSLILDHDPFHHVSKPITFFIISWKE